MKLEDICNKLTEEEKSQLVEMLTTQQYRVEVGFWDDEKTNIKFLKEFLGDQPHGKSIWWWENGQKYREDEYHQGQPHGKSFRWYENGQKWWEKEYYEGKLHGKSFGWYKNGQKSWEIEYHQGKLINEKLY